jgi:hypothetical protein
MAKLGLIVGTSEYEDKKLSRLQAPTGDVSDLADVLQSQEIGNFDSITLRLNETWSVVQESIARLFAKKEKNDTLLLYFSGHGIRDEDGELYLAVKNTETDFLSATAISASFISRVMDKCSSKRQILILDCCHSGAFAKDAKAMPGTIVGTEEAFKGEGYGRVVLTASDATQYAWEGSQILGDPYNSVFTYFLVEGLRTGKADIDLDGLVTPDELYKYIFDRVASATSKQKPRKWVYTQEGTIVIAKNPHAAVKAFELPAELRQLMESPYPEARELAVRKLNEQLNAKGKGVVFEALTALKQLKQDRDSKIAMAATTILTAYEHREQRVESIRVETDSAPTKETQSEGPATEQEERSLPAPEETAPITRATHLTKPDDSHYNTVINALLNGRVIFFLGAGVNLVNRSPEVDWQSGDYLPSNSELTKYLARKFNFPLANVYDLMKVSQYIADSYGAGTLYDELHRTFDRDYQPTSIHKFFARLPGLLRAKGHRPQNQLIISLTYDDVLERAFSEAGEPFDVVSYIAEGEKRGRFLHQLPSGETRVIEAPNEYSDLSHNERTTILKLHGSVNRRNPEYDSFVINEDDFIDYMTRTDISRLMPVQLAAKLRRSHFLFLGYSLSDWSLRVILQRIWGEQRLKYSSWAVLLHPDESELMFWNKRNVNVFNVDLKDYIGSLRERLEVLPLNGSMS